MKTYWHFINKDRRLSYGDRRLVEVGKTLTVDYKPVLGIRGLHASEQLIDALYYAPGFILCKVTLGGKIVEGNNKVVAAERTVIAIADVSDIVSQWSKRVALDVVYLWNAPQVVLEFLNGDDSKAKEAEKAASATRAATIKIAAKTAAETAEWAAKTAENTAWSAVMTADAAADTMVAWSTWSERTAAMNKYNAWLEAMVEQATWEIVE